jgi:hypothetical protein
MYKLHEVTKFLIGIAVFLFVCKLLFMWFSSLNEKQYLEAANNLPLHKNTQQKLVQLTKEVNIDGKKIPLITEKEIRSVKIKNTYFSDTNILHPNQQILNNYRCFWVKSEYDKELQTKLDKMCLTESIFPETNRWEVVAILQEMRDNIESLRNLHYAYHSYEQLIGITLLYNDSIFGFKIFGVIFYLVITILCIEGINFYYYRKIS